MAKTKISEFSSTPGNNTDIDSINISEGCAPSGINNAIRELMAQLKDFQTGAAGDSFNGPIGTTTAAAGAFTTLTASSTATLNTLASSGATLTGGTINNMAIGGTTAAAGSFTTLTTSGAVTHNAGTANGVAFLNGSKVLTTGSALTFDGANLGVGGSPIAGVRQYVVSSGTPEVARFEATGISAAYTRVRNGSVDAVTVADSGFGLVKIGSSTNHPVLFLQNDTEQMRLTSTGLGIGTSSPSTRLTVESAASDTTVRVYSALSGSLFYAGYQVARAGVTAGASMRAARNPAVGGVGWEWLTTVDNGAEISGTYTSRMTLDSSGNLGLGVTPSASTLPTLQSSFGIFTGNNQANIAANAYYASQWNYTSTAIASLYTQTAGQHRWYTAPSGTAGNAISFTQAMTLDASGLLALGTTSPASATRLTLDYPGFVQMVMRSSGTDRISLYGDASVSAVDAKANPLAFYAGNAERARIDSSGNLLIGTTISAGNSGSVGARKGGTGELILLANNGGLFQQAVSSYFLVTTAGGNTSDATLKKNVQQLSGALAKVCAIRGVNFEFIAEQKSTPDNGVQVGVIAQEVEAQYPEIVVTNEDGIKSVRYEKLVAPLIEAIKEQQAIITALTARITALESN